MVGDAAGCAVVNDGTSADRWLWKAALYGVEGDRGEGPCGLGNWCSFFLAGLSSLLSSVRGNTYRSRGPLEVSIVV